MKTAVLLLAYGGPTRLEDVPAYLAGIRGGRPTPQGLVDEFIERYRTIGGKSPLLEITQSLASKLQDRLCLPVYVGMRHWHPYIEDTVAQMAVLGVEHTVALCLTPHYSKLSVGAYRQRLDEALAAAGKNLAVDFIPSWHLQTGFIAGLADRVAATLAGFPDPAGVKVLFTAHSLPAAIVDEGDPYAAQVRATAANVAERLGLPADRWLLAYQSAARRSVPWLGPSVEEAVCEQAALGVTDLLVAPVGFISDQVEILYDLDIQLQRIAREAGAHVQRTPMFNASAEMVDILAALVTARLCAEEPARPDCPPEVRSPEAAP